MNYIYDIMLNYNDYFLEFYDWNESDNIVRIRKIPIFKISNKDFCDLKKYYVHFDKKFIERIKNKTEYFCGRTIKLETSFLVTDGLDIMAIKIDKRLKYSSIQINEELDILEEINIKEISLKFEKLNLIKKTNFKTRLQMEKEKKVIKKINEILKEKNISKIKYLYYECFNEKENDYHKIINNLKKIVKNDEMILKISNTLNNKF